MSISYSPSLYRYCFCSPDMIPTVLRLTRASQGAKQIGKYLLDKYGEDYFALLIDEGGEHPSNNYIPILHAERKPQAATSNSLAPSLRRRGLRRKVSRKVVHHND